jgi:predicted dehydrogenase
MGRLRMGVVGVGHLGKEHARILSGLPDVELVGVADVNGEQAQAVARRCGCRAFDDYGLLLPLLDAVVVAVPTTHHHAVATAFLRRGIPVLVEKPLAATLAEAEALADLARNRRTPLQIGHIERFNPAFEEARRRPLQPKFIQCQRLGPFTGRSTDIGAVLDLMIHDLDLLLTLVPAPVCSVEALGISVFGSHEDVANARLRFSNGCIAEVSASRASPAPRRLMSLWGPEGYIGLDFAKRAITLMQPSEQLRRYGLDPRRLDPASLAMLKSDLFGRHLEVLELECHAATDALTRELQHFVHCVQTGTPPLVGGDEGRDAVALASQVLERIHAHRWDGNGSGPVGPLHLPAPLGPLFQRPTGEAAA